jgi:uncharacterized protein
MATNKACDLPDVNVWLALLNGQHPHHQAAKAYWDSAEGQRIAFCRITMLGLLRLSTNKTVMGGTPYTADEAWQAYQAVIDLPEVSLIAEPLGIEVAMQKLTLSPESGAPDWTDAYLSAFASLAGLRMVSFDKGFTQYRGLDLLTLKTS